MSLKRGKGIDMNETKLTILEQVRAKVSVIGTLPGCWRGLATSTSTTTTGCGIQPLMHTTVSKDSELASSTTLCPP